MPWHRNNSKRGSDKAITVNLKVFPIESIPALKDKSHNNYNAYVRLGELKNADIDHLIMKGCCFLHAYSNPKCIIRVIHSDAVPPGPFIALNQVQQINSQVTSDGETFLFSLFQDFDNVPDLMDITLDIKLLGACYHGSSNPYAFESSLIFPASEIIKTFSKSAFTNILSDSELFTVTITAPVKKRAIEDGNNGSEQQNDDLIDISFVCCSNQLTAEASEEDHDEGVEEAEENAQFGIMQANTRIFVQIDPAIEFIDQQVPPTIHHRKPYDNKKKKKKGKKNFAKKTSNAANINLKKGVYVKNDSPQKKKETMKISKNYIDIFCGEEEDYFPVHRKILKPCLALTKIVLGESTNAAAGERDKVYVKDVDCVNFDRCLRYLEAVDRKQDDGFTVPYSQAEEILHAARELKIVGLEAICLEVLGKVAARVSKTGYKWDEIVRRIDEDKNIILIIDYMVLDVTQWIFFHPGGYKIIPEQALKKDATVFFEIFHSSQESFNYLKQFYIGEICMEDRNKIPKASKGEASSDFYARLRQFTDSFRVRLRDEEQPFKSF